MFSLAVHGTAPNILISLGDQTLPLVKVWWRSEFIWPPYEDLKKNWTDGWTDRQKDVGQTNGQTENRMDGQMDRQTNGRTDKWTDRQTDGRTKGRMDKPTYKQTDRQTDGQTDNRQFYIRILMLGVPLGLLALVPGGAIHCCWIG